MNKIFTQISTFVLAAAACLGANAQTEADNTMYLIKGDHVVGKYNVDDVDYVSFKLPEGVIEGSLWITMGEVGKNKVSYTVNTLENTTAYAHGLISYYLANYYAMDMEGDYFENIAPESQQVILQSLLSYYGYVGIGTDTYTHTDWADDGTGSRFEVTPGNKYYVCAWEVDPQTQRPLESFAFEEVNTAKPGQSNATLDVTFKRQNEQGLAFDIQGSDDILYIVTAYGVKSIMDRFVEAMGMDYLMGTFGARWTIASLQGDGDIPGIEAATWPVDGAGEYVMYVRAYDANGDMVETSCTATAEEETSAGPEIKIFSRSKGDGKVSVNFEISPSNVSEAYVRLMKENDVDDALNDGWEYYELASSSQGTDIVDIINTTGEYTFTADGLSDQEWYSLLIYARDNDGARSTLRLNFATFDSEWAEQGPYHAPSAKVIAPAKSRRPVLNRVTR